GVSPKYVEIDGYPIINQKCIRGESLSLQEARMTSRSKKISDEKFIRPGDILINSTGTGTLGRTAIVKNVNQETTVDTHVTIVRANDLVDKHFLGYLIRYYEPLITSLGKGATNQIELSATDLKEMKVAIPTSKNTQQKIAKIVSAYDDLIENNKKRIKLLEEQAQLVYEEWFVRMKFPDYENIQIDAETGCSGIIKSDHA
ncbi:restriction endonuclease subunit S, partial [Psychrobacter celer]|uniref:restriction endonuclease subunit S n=1 Tax=Psychrobacter celer TaxID=306572 RepID=UPI003FD5F290